MLIKALDLKSAVVSNGAFFMRLMVEPKAVWTIEDDSFRRKFPKNWKKILNCWPVVFPGFAVKGWVVISGCFGAREGVIHVCYENDSFHDPDDVILMSWMAVSEVVVITNVTVVVSILVELIFLTYFMLPKIPKLVFFLILDWYWYHRTENNTIWPIDEGPRK